MNLINRPLKGLALAALGFALASPVMAQQTLDALYQKVSADARAESAYNSEREAEFLSRANEREQMLETVKSQLAEQEQRRETMKGMFDENEAVLSELTEQLDRRTGNLGELFGVFRQVSGDMQSIFFDSIVSAEFPERLETIETLADASEVPTIPEMQQLWSVMMQEIAESGHVSRFDSEIVLASGETYEAPVVRVGTFNVVSGDTYLNYESSTQELVELPRQPSGSVRSTAGALYDAGAGEAVAFALDPSRGSLLSLLVQSPSLGERVQQGKEVGYAILFIGFIGLLIVIERLIKLSRVSQRMRRQLKDMDHAESDNPLGRMMLAYYENRHLNDLDALSKKLDEVIFKDLAELRRGLSVIKVLAAIAPLMGLLGTVTGMIGTFQAITLFGTGDPKLMAGGISQALITTVLGLVVAIPLLLSSSLLSSRVQQLSKMIGEQATGLVADKAVDIAKTKA
ncbi:MotA/TolQ/ExbB proton channel family protein [Marinimicrobium sp. ARAG 43.8]|uniref:MotA/TolQ/ExbB proton channel family protein n=1 Tax=Marinimicrobium sp. ARAG 43.8 TaxID=3418719 RepID=UPI003CEAE806